MPSLRPLSFLAALPLSLSAWAQPEGWQVCAAIEDGPKRLACFDRWTATQAPATPAAATPAAPAAPSALEPTAAVQPAPLPPPVGQQAPRRGIGLTAREGCHDSRYTSIARFWELEPGADCDTFGIRGYRPITLAVATADTINRQPTSGNPENNAPSSTDYRTTEARLQVSLRTKVAQNILTRGSKVESDSLWFAYTQQSYWQIFTPQLSRPFRSTDHEPEVMYVYPLQQPQEGAWKLRYGGLGLVHQSNGQSLPYSRSWNRAYAMLGGENGPFQLHGRVWTRIAEGGEDDNPGIGDYVGRGELQGIWQVNRGNILMATLRHSLTSDHRGSVRLEWFRTLADDLAGPPGGLQFHVRLFSGYGDTLLDYNLRRTTLSVGLSLVEW